jgi:hypothetical protein
MHTMTPLGSIARGALAGCAGTLAMDVLWYSRYRRDGGASGFVEWETASGVTWANASAPARLGRKVVAGVFDRELPDDLAPITSNIVHWAYGAAWGAGLGVVSGTVGRYPPKVGLVFGPVVWTSGYVILPQAKIYKQMWEYDLPTLGKDLSAHLVYGVVTATVLRLLADRTIRR